MYLRIINNEIDYPYSLQKIDVGPEPELILRKKTTVINSEKGSVRSGSKKTSKFAAPYKFLEG